MTEHEEATPMTDAPAPVEDPTVDQPSAAQDEPAKPESAEALEASAAGTAAEGPVEGAGEAPADEPAAGATPTALSLIHTSTCPQPNQWRTRGVA